MKIAIPSNDNINISQHFGKSKGFTICEIKGNEVISRKYIENNFTGHVQDLHMNEEHHLHSNQGHGNHSHESILKAIGNCQVVIVGGMGKKLYNDFARNNIQVFVTKETSIDTAINSFINDTLDSNPDKCCQH